MDGPPLQDSRGGALTWVADVPLVTNPVILRAMGFVLGFSYLLVALVFGTVLAFDDHLERLPPFLFVLLIAIAAAAVLIVLVMLVVFRNRMRCRFVIDDDGLTSVIVDRRAAIGGSLAFMAGAASANATLAGAGLGTAGSQREYTKWSRVSGARYVPERHFIGLSAAGWWPVGAIHCTAESYPAVAARVREILHDRPA